MAPPIKTAATTVSVNFVLPATIDRQTFLEASQSVQQLTALFAPRQEVSATDIQISAPERWGSLTQVSHRTVSDSEPFMSQHREWLGTYRASEKRWQDRVNNPDAATSVDDISETIDDVFVVMSAMGASAIRLSNLNADQVSGEHLAAVLRATYSVRDETPGWGEATKVAAVALRKAGQDPQDALFGLYTEA